MKYEAVIFDLYGTLIDNLTGPPYREIITRMSSILSVPVDDFHRLWSATIRERHTGVFRSVADSLVHICHELGVKPAESDVRLADEIRQDYVKKFMTRPKPDAVEVLSQLKRWGYRVGLISNCTPETPVVWPDTPFFPLFDTAVFSSSAGLMKPDPSIYEIMVEQLAVIPDRCFYIADGVNGELAGALKAGMHPVRISFSDEDSVDLDLEEWDGPVISSLNEILTLVR